MKWRYLLLAALGIVLMTIFLGLSLPGTVDRRALTRRGVEKSRQQVQVRGEEWENLRSGPPRAIGASAATHSPDRLRDFVLSEMEIHDASLRKAVEQVMAAYREICQTTGEFPLELTFSIPEPAPRISARLKGRDLDSSIRMLALLARMKVVRRGLEYRFEPYGLQTERLTKAIPMPRDLAAKLDHLALIPADPSLAATLEAKLSAMGLKLDPSTRLSRTAKGELVVETTSISDRVAIEAITRLVSQERTRQHQLTAKLIEIPAGISWQLPANGEFDSAGEQLLMRDLAEMPGIDLMAMPTVVAHDGQMATVEMSRKIIAPITGPDKGASADVGQVLRLEADSLGFGHEVAVNFTDTSGGLTPAGELSVEVKTRIEGTEFTRDQGTRVMIQTRQDGSRALLLLSPVLIDPEGLPARVE